MEYYVSTALSHDRGEGAEPGCGFLPLGVELKTVSEDPELVGLSDGLFTLPFLKQSKEDSTGLYASGFQVEDLASLQQKAGEGGQASPQSELQVADSDRNLIDLTIKDFGVAAEKPAIPSAISRFTPPTQTSVEFL